MKHIFWFQHNWKIKDYLHGKGSIVNRLNFEKEAEDVPMTEILYKCECGAIKTKTIKGHWDLKGQNATT